MRNAINYYYNLNPENIHQNKDQVQFSYNNYHYILLPYERNVNEIDELVELSIELYYNGVYVHQFVYNKENKILTNINNKVYVLLLILVNNYEKKIELYDIVDFANKGSMVKSKKNLARTDWFDLWTKKTDYFEYQISQIGKKYPIIRESFSYFIGLAENGIIFIKTIQTNIVDKKMSVVHKRIKYNYTLLELYNPLYFIQDSRIRDLCEYFKEKLFYSEEDVFEEMTDYINQSNFSIEELHLFFARLLFPTFYFDLYEEIIHDGVEEKEVLKIISKINDYERFLKQTYKIFKNIVAMPNIEWLNKT